MLLNAAYGAMMSELGQSSDANKHKKMMPFIYSTEVQLNKNLGTLEMLDSNAKTRVIQTDL